MSRNNIPAYLPDEDLSGGNAPSRIIPSRVLHYNGSDERVITPRLRERLQKERADLENTKWAELCRSRNLDPHTAQAHEVLGALPQSRMRDADKRNILSFDDDRAAACIEALALFGDPGFLAGVVDVADLTHREAELAGLITDGAVVIIPGARTEWTLVAAEYMNISASAVRTHYGNLSRKLIENWAAS